MGITTRSTGPSPMTWYAMLTLPLFAYLVSGRTGLVSSNGSPEFKTPDGRARRHPSNDATPTIACTSFGRRLAVRERRPD